MGSMVMLQAIFECRIECLIGLLNSTVESNQADELDLKSNLI